MMKHNTPYFFCLTMSIAAICATGCRREVLSSGIEDNGILKFSVDFAGGDAINLSKGAVLTSEDGTVSIPLSCTVTDGIEVTCNDATKGTQIDSESEFRGEGLTSFKAGAWNGDGSGFIPDGTQVSYTDGKWQTSDVYRWKGSDDKTFLAYANLPASATVVNSADPVKQTFTYTVPTDARQQNDIMLGWYEGDGDGTSTASITMVHPLTAVVFKMGEIDASVTAIKSISISGVYVSGTTDVTYALPDGPTYDWKAGTGADTRTGSQTVTLGPAEDETEIVVGADNVIGVPFIILPQTVAANALTLTITVVKDGEEAVLLAAVPAGTWQEGRTNTFTIGYSSPLLPGKFSVSATEYVQFSKGNLFCTDKGGDNYEFSFEEKQYDYRCRYGLTGDKAVLGGTVTTTPQYTSGLFQWIPRTSRFAAADWGAFTSNTVDSDDTFNDVLDFGGVFPGSDWTTLTGVQWKYLLDNHKNKFVTVIGVNGLAIAPDDYEGEISASYTTLEQWAAAEAAGIVFLPIYACYITQLGKLETSELGYWSSSPNTGNKNYATALHFYGTSSFNVNERWRVYGQNVRLVQKSEWPEIEPSFIDLGLPSGTLWADVNVGATSKTGEGSYGKLYAWGETETKASFTIDNYRFMSSFTKYNATDGLTILDLVDDAAYAFDGKSVIPTREQYEELINSTYTTCTWTDNYNSTGVPGLVITSKSNSNSIFLPAAGLQNGPTLGLVKTNGCYWSSTLNPTPNPGSGTAFPACVIDLDFDKNTLPNVYQDNDDSRRFLGQSIRAVKLNAVKPTPALSYNINGGTGATMPSGGTFTAGDFVTVQAPTGTPVRDGYTFIRYNTNANGGGDVYYPGDKFRILDDVTLYAEYGATLKKGDEFNSAIGSPTKLVFDYHSVWSSTVGPWSEGTDVGAGSDASHIKEFTVGTTVYILSDCIISLNEDCHDMLSGKSSITEIDFGNGVIDTHKVTNFQYTFSACSGLTTLDLSDFDTKSVSNFAHMFNSCSNLETIKVSDKWECGKRIPDTNGEHSNVFGGCNKLVGGNGTTFNDSHKGASYAQVDGNGGNPGYFTLK